MAEFKIHFPPVSSTKTLKVYIPRTYAISKTTLQAHEHKWKNFRSRAEWKNYRHVFFNRPQRGHGVRGGAVGSGTALHAGWSRVRFPMGLPGFVTDLILPAAYWPCGPLSLQQKWVPGVSRGGWRQPVRTADNLATFKHRMPRKSRSLTLLKP